MRILGGDWLNITRLEVMGIYVIFMLGFVLHSAYEILGNPRFISPFVPVNESVWEHLKLAAWATLLYALFELGFLYPHTPNFLLAKVTSVFIAPLVLMILHYSYKSITGFHILIFDIITFGIAIYLAQSVSAKIMHYPQSIPLLNWVALFMLIVLLSSFTYFTYHPPKLPIFQDSSTGGYGIPK